MSLTRRLDKVRARLPRLRGRVQGRGAIVVAGDSLCGGRAPVLLGDLAREAGMPVRVVSVWRGGIGVGELPGLLAKASSRMNSTRVQAVVVLVGGNEAKRGCAPSEDRLLSGLSLCLDGIRSVWPDAFIVLCTVPIPGAHPALRADADTMIGCIVNPAIRAVAAARGAALCDLETLFDGIAAARCDGVHPTSRGDRLLAEAWFAAIRAHRAATIASPVSTGAAAESKAAER